MVTVEETPDLSSSPVETSTLRSLLMNVVEDHSNQETGTITVILGTHTLIHSLNVEYLGHDYNTDVLAFNLSEKGSDQLNGEIYVDVETAYERHAEFDNSVEAEVVRYAVHGLLHLLGHSDKTTEGQAEMRRLEDIYVNQVVATR